MLATTSAGDLVVEIEYAGKYMAGSKACTRTERLLVKSWFYL